MRVLFYHPVANGSVEERIERIKRHTFRGELLYGASELPKYECQLIWPPTKLWGVNTLKHRLYYTFWMLFHQRQYDVIYSAYFNGLEWIIMLHGLGLFRKRIVVWHHSPINRALSWKRRLKQKIFFKGINSVLFFTESLKQVSDKDIIPEQKMHVMQWGPDMNFYDSNRVEYERLEGGNYLMSGSDSRDFSTCEMAFAGLDVGIDIYPTKDAPRINSDNITYHYLKHDNDGYLAMAKATAFCKAVLIITKPLANRKLPSGLTSICEAVGLGKPCIITDNQYFSDDMRNAGFAIFVRVGDVNGIRLAVNRLENDPQLRKQMSCSALNYARNHSLDLMTKSLVGILENE